MPPSFDPAMQHHTLAAARTRSANGARMGVGEIELRWLEK